MKLLTTLLAVTACAFTLTAADKDGFKSLFNGKDLEEGGEKFHGGLELRAKGAVERFSAL